MVYSGVAGKPILKWCWKITLVATKYNSLMVGQLMPFQGSLLWCGIITCITAKSFMFTFLMFRKGLFTVRFIGTFLVNIFDHIKFIQVLLMGFHPPHIKLLNLHVKHNPLTSLNYLRQNLQCSKLGYHKYRYFEKAYKLDPPSYCFGIYKREMIKSSIKSSKIIFRLHIL